ncbi:uncharacterized protein LOC114075175 [Solanum pennellii]|uniref:Uncharacterized protein LOC114075175 n=1 Tax=Solanum pennellii TaxID=28526 RepID=A0ABM1V0K1_SOLPN|nr:uncharacterized protein LOC114075175 [Solanum pennellii]
MPSGSKKRRAAKRKKEAKQNEEFTTVSVVKMTIPVEELAKGAVWHEATSVDKEIGKGKNIIVEVPNEFKAQAKETDVSMKLVELNEVKNTIDEVSDNVPLVDVTSNEDILVSNDVPVLSTNTCCIMENVESSGISQEHGSSGVETEPLTSAVEQMIEQLSDDVTADEIIERDVPGVVTDVEVLEANEVDTGSDVFKDDSVMENVVEGNEESLLNVNTNDQNKEISKDVMFVSQNSGCVVESVELGESVVVPEMTIDSAPLVSVNVMSNESIKEEVNNGMIHGQSADAVEEENNGLSPQSSNELVKQNAASAEKIGLSDSNETGTVSPSTEDNVTETRSNPNELLDVPQVTVPRETEDQVYFACPKVHLLFCVFYLVVLVY